MVLPYSPAVSVNLVSMVHCTESTVVTASVKGPTRAVVDGPASDPDHQAVDERHVLEELLEVRLIELPEPRIIDVEATEFALNVVVQRSGVGQHVGLNTTCMPISSAYFHMVPELLDHRLVPGAVRAVFG